MGTGILLIHGYTGVPGNFGRLPDALAAACPEAKIESITLPGHPSLEPDFDAPAFLKVIHHAAETLTKEGRELILVGHSTGGVLALAAMAEHTFSVKLLVLAATPKCIDGSVLTRWNTHSEAAAHISFSSLARMVALINSMGAKPFDRCPVLVLQGEEDDLVSCSEATEWRTHFKPGMARAVIVPQGEHHLFTGPGKDFAIDIIERTILDTTQNLSPPESQSIQQLMEDEPEVGAFLQRSPFSARHLALCPSGRGEPAKPSAQVDCEPVFANIEITTHCNLQCAFCARTALNKPSRHMPLQTFRRILDLLPHAYRITLVGLGEPLLHPDVVDFVAEAKSLGRRVALVTNALMLTPECAERLIGAGLDSIAFSLDAPTSELANQVRAGTDLHKAITHIKDFNALAKATRPIARAVFTAVSMTTLPFLEALVRLVAELGVDVLMLSDLNFQRNLPQTLWKNQNDSVAATVRQAIRTAFALRLPILSVRGLETFALARHYQKHLLVPPSQLYTRSRTHTHCCSPWQTLPVSVDGTFTVCDCQPEQVVGNLLEQPFSELWKKGAMQKQRWGMISGLPVEACEICPRY